MILIAILIGAILVVAAIRNTQGALFSALATDVPAFVIWAAAIIALGALGYVPGLKPVSRGLLALVIIVIILREYQQIIAGFQGAIASGSTAGASNASGSASTVASVPSLAAVTASPSVSVPSTPAVANPGNLNNLTVPVGPFGDIMGPQLDFIGNTAPSGFVQEYQSGFGGG